MKWFTFSVLSLIFILTPFQKGLYFDHDLYFINILVIILFFIFIIKQFIKNELILFQKSLFILLIPLCYLISLSVAESPKGAWDSLLRWLFYSSFFILLIWTTTNPKIKQVLPILFLLLGAVLSLSMVFDFYGWIHYPNALVKNRFGGVFQYPNTYGMVMSLFFFFSFMNLTEEKVSSKNVFLHSSLSLLCFVCFIQSSSRGMMVLFPGIWLMGLLLLPVKKQLIYLLYTLFMGITSFNVYLSMVKGSSTGSHYPGILMFIIMLILTNGINYFINLKLANHSFKCLNKITLKKWGRFVLPLVIVSFLFLGLLDFMDHGLVFQQLPKNLQDRLGNISLSTPTAKERMSFFKDALSMSKTSPLIGFGGGGWAGAYKNFQSSPYISNKVHNGYLESVIEIGWLGLLLLLSVFIYYFYLLVRSYLEDKNSSIKISVILALLTLFLHSAIDFNLSFGTVWLMIPWLFAIDFLKFHPARQRKKVQHTDLKIKLILVIFAFFLITGLWQTSRFLYAQQQFSKAKVTNDITLKVQLLNKAVSSDPYNVNYMANLSNVYLAQIKDSNNIEIKKNAEVLLDKMVITEPRNSTLLLQNATFALQMGDPDRALNYLNAAMKVDHFNSILYQYSIATKVKMAINYKNNSNLSKSNYLVNSAITDFKKEKVWYSKIDHTHAGKVFNSRDFTITSTTRYYAAMAYFLNKEYPEAINITGKVTPKEDLYNDLLAIRILANEKLGKHVSVNNDPNLTETVGNLRRTLN